MDWQLQQLQSQHLQVSEILLIREEVQHTAGMRRRDHNGCWNSGRVIFQIFRGATKPHLLRSS